MNALSRYQARSRRLGMTGYVGVLAALPGTTAEIQERTGLCSNTVNKLMRELHVLRVVYWAASVKSPVLRAGHVVVWGVGNLPDCQHSKPVPKIQPRAAVIAFASVVRALQTPQPAQEIVQATGVSYATVRAVIRALRKRKLCHIGEWEKRHGSPIARHVWGPGEDRKKPRPISRQQINARFNAGMAAKRKHLRMIHATAGNDARVLEAA